MFPTQFAHIQLNAIFTYLSTQNVVRLNKWLSVCLTTDRKTELRVHILNTEIPLVRWRLNCMCFGQSYLVLPSPVMGTAD